MADDNKPTADQIQFALDLAKEKGKDYTKSKLQGMSGKEVSDAIDSMKKEETEASGKQVEFALDLLKEQGKSSPSKAQLDKMPAANISKLIDKLKGSEKKASMKKQAVIQEVMKRAKADPEFRKKLVAQVRAKQASFPEDEMPLARLPLPDMHKKVWGLLEGTRQYLGQFGAGEGSAPYSMDYYDALATGLRKAETVLRKNKVRRPDLQAQRLAFALAKKVIGDSPRQQRNAAGPGGGPVTKKEYDTFFKHLMAAYKMASKWETQDKPGGYVANESIGAFMEKLKRDMKKHVK